MKFLKVLANAVLCAFFFAGLVALLTYDININLIFTAGAFVRLALAMAVFYGPIMIPAVVLFFFIVQFFSGRRFAVRVVSPSFLAVAFPLLIVFFLFIFWENCGYYSSFFEPAAGALLRTQGITLAVLAVLGEEASTARSVFRAVRGRHGSPCLAEGRVPAPPAKREDGPVGSQDDRAERPARRARRIEPRYHLPSHRRGETA
jgi:hypothetical protein